MDKNPSEFRLPNSEFVALSADVEATERNKLAAVFPECFVEGKLDIDKIIKLLAEYKPQNSYKHFDKYIERFTKAHHKHLNYLKDEAFNFVRQTSDKYSNNPQV